MTPANTAAAEAPVVSISTGQVILYFAGGTITILFMVVGFFFTRTLRQIDGNQGRTTQIQDRLFEKLDTLCEDFYTLKGEHKARIDNYKC
jgi:hypothetical protein